MKINEADFKHIDESSDLRKIPTDEIVLLQIEDFWDGALSGMCKWKNEDYYFHCFDQIDEETDTDHWPRKYLLIKLTPAQTAEYERGHKLFEESNASLSVKTKYLELQKDTPTMQIKPDQLIGWFDSEGI